MGETMQKKIGNMASTFIWLTVLVFIVAIPLAVNAASTQAKAQTAGIIDLNTASEQDIMALQGVGPATAKKIIAARPFTSVDELSKAGLSAKKIEAIKPFVTAGSSPAAAVPATPVTKSVPAVSSSAKGSPVSTAKLAAGQVVNINTADSATLEALPGIGPAKAQAIIAGRPYTAKEDVMKIKGIKQGVFNKIKDSITVK
jgi:competence ComEA-like helix-hairpin-helix protein